MVQVREFDISNRVINPVAISRRGLRALFGIARAISVGAVERCRTVRQSKLAKTEIVGRDRGGRGW
jgi:hypothetical protein